MSTRPHPPTRPIRAAAPPPHLAMALTRSDETGGVQIYVRDLAEALSRRGWRVTVLGGGEGPLWGWLEAAGIPSIQLRHLNRELRPGRDLLAWWELSQALARLRPDLLSLHSAKAGWLGRAVGRRLRIPTLYTAHGWPFSAALPGHIRRLYRWLEGVAAGWAEGVITVCEADRARALEELPLDPARVHAIHNGVQMPDGPPARPERQPPRILMAARFCPQKDHETLLQALRRLRAIPWTLELAGDGPGRPQVQARIEALGLADRVECAGFLPHLGRALGRAQLAVLSTRWEGLPLFLLEAMGAGLPVIATRVGGVAEAVTPGQTGELVPPGDPAALAEALERLLTRPALRASMGAEGARVARERFSHAGMVDRIDALFRQTLQAAP